MAAVPQLLPPDQEQLSFAKEVNALLGGESKVSLYRMIKPEGGTEYGVVFQYGTARKNYVSPVAFFDVETMVCDVKAWVKRL